MQTQRDIPLVALLDWKRQIHELYARVRGDAQPERAWEMWRERREEMFRRHPASPIPPARRGSFSGLSYFDYDPALRVDATFQEAPVQRVDVAGSTTSFTLQRSGRLNFTLPSGDAMLDVYWVGGYGGGAFVPLRDATSGETTYGGGRYVLDTIKGADLGGVGERLILDFNFAYNPSCSYDPAWACPLAPAGNTLEAAIRAGERHAAES